MQILLDLDEVFAEGESPHSKAHTVPVEQTQEPAIIPLEEHASRRNDLVRWGSGQCRRLVGNGFSRCPPSTVPEAILAAPIVLCPRCHSRPVLAELRKLTGGLCYPCWEREVRS